MLKKKEQERMEREKVRSILSCVFCFCSFRKRTQKCQNSQRILSHRNRNNPTNHPKYQDLPLAAVTEIAIEIVEIAGDLEAEEVKKKEKELIAFILLYFFFCECVTK